MSISNYDLPGLQSNFTSLSSLKDTPSIISSATSAVTPKITDPVGAVLISTMASINSLSTSIYSKMDTLEADLIKSVGNTGKVVINGNKIFVTTDPADASKVSQFQSKLQGDINSINSVISKLQLVTTSLSIVSETAAVLKAAMDVQEILLTVGNPVAKATMTLIKSALKILFYKDVLSEYVNIISSQSAAAQQSLNDIISRFSGLSIQFNTNSALSSGNILTPDQAQTSIVDSSLSASKSTYPQTYVNSAGKSYTLSVESYNSKEIVGRARDSFSGLLVAETTPSFISTPDQLVAELKTILN